MTCTLYLSSDSSSEQSYHICISNYISSIGPTDTDHNSERPMATDKSIYYYWRSVVDESSL